MAKNIALTIKTDTSEIHSLIDQASEIDFNVETQVFRQVVKGLFNLLDLSKEIVTVQPGRGSTRTGELLIRLEPSDRLRRIFSAILARNIDTLIAEHKNLLTE